MIETQQSVLVHAPIGDIWTHVRDIERWAQIMPGYQNCEIIDDDNSRWTLKVGVGGLVRTVNVNVRVEEWAGPERARFTFKLKGDPVEGGGSYIATPRGPDATDLALQVQVVGSGPMAPMWEAMGGPVLPKFAQAFAEELRDDIYAALDITPPSPTAETERPPLLARVRAWLQGLVRRLFFGSARRRRERAPEEGRRSSDG